MENIKIEKVIAEEEKDSRGRPTLRVSVYAMDKIGTFLVPSGASTGIHEANELRDGDGRGVNKAIENVNTIINDAIVGMNIFDQRAIDEKMLEMDGTINKSNLGGNAIIGVSMACACLASSLLNKDLYEYLRSLAEILPSRKVPHLYMNLINGGVHAKNDLAFQEYHIVTKTEDVAHAIDIGFKIQNSLKEMFAKDLGEESLELGDEGGYAPKISDIRKPLEYLQKAVKENNLEDEVFFALDVAASSFYENGKYKVNGKEIDKEELLNIYNSLIKEFNLLSIEDPFEEEDFESFRKLKESNPNIIVMADDLTVTNKILLQKAIDNNSINAMIIKPNQVGTLTETLDTMKLARENNIELIVSHRSGETMDAFIGDLSYAFNCFGLKSGSPVKEERIVKYNRLLEIVNKNK